MIKEENLIFLISQPRSGSTVLQKILSNNDYIASTSEPWILLPFAGMLYPHLNNAIYNTELSFNAVNEFLKTSEEQEFFKSIIKKGVLDIYNQKVGGQRYFLDKTPRYYEIFDFIKDFFPKSKIIILKRHPLAVLHSIIETWKTDDFFKLSNYSRDILSAPFIIHEFAHKNLNNPNVKVVKFEDFAEDPGSIVQGLFQWLEIPFEEKYLHYTNNQKLSGSYGDFTGINKFSQVTKSNADSWIAGFNNSYWSDFFKGYSNYLGQDFLADFGQYSVPAVKKTKCFDDYTFYCNYNLQSYPVKSFKSLYKLGKITWGARMNKGKNKIYF